MHGEMESAVFPLMVTEVIGLQSRWLPILTISMPSSYPTVTSAMSRISTEIREQLATAPLMFMIDLYEPLYCSPLHSRSSPLLIVHQCAAVDSCELCRLVYRSPDRRRMTFSSSPNDSSLFSDEQSNESLGYLHLTAFTEPQYNALCRRLVSLNRVSVGVLLLTR